MEAQSLQEQPLTNDGMTADTAPAQNAENAQTPSAQNQQTNSNNRAQTFIDALHALEKGSANDAAQNAEKLAALYAENATLTNAALELVHRKVEGREAVAAFWREYKATLGESFSSFSHVVESDDSTGLFWTTQSQSAPKYHGATLLQFNGAGEIEFFRGYYDTRELELKK